LGLHNLIHKYPTEASLLLAATLFVLGYLEKHLGKPVWACGTWAWGLAVVCGTIAFSRDADIFQIAFGGILFAAGLVVILAIYAGTTRTGD